MVTPGLADAWAELAAQRPDRDAVVAGDDRRTFADLLQRATGVRGWLVAGGMATGDRVVLVLPNGPDIIVTLCGALAAGLVPVTIDERASADEVHHVVDSTDAKAVVHGPEATHMVARAVKRIQRPWRPKLLELGPSLADSVIATMSEPTPYLGAQGNVVLVGPPPGSSGPATRLDTDTLVEVGRGAEGGSTGAHLVLAPLAHGAGLVGSLTTISAGSTVVVPPVASRTIDDLLAIVTRERVARVTVDHESLALGLALRDAVPGLTVDHASTRAGVADPRTHRSMIETAGGPVDPVRGEAILGKHRSVTACRVVGLATRNGAPAMVALVRVADDHHLDAAELRAWSRRKLAANEMPRVWLFVDGLDVDAPDAELRATAVALLRPA